MELVFEQVFPSREEALSAEQRIKGWSRKADLGEVIKGIGFEQDFRPNGAMIYHGFGMMIERQLGGD